MSSPDAMICQDINGVQIQRSDADRVLLVNNVLMRFSRMEYAVILLLLERPCQDQTLLQRLYQCQIVDEQTKEALGKRITCARAKLRTLGLDIVRMHNWGYALVLQARHDQSA